MKLLIVFSAFLLLASAADAQSLFSPLPKPKAPAHNVYARSLVGPFDTLPAGQSYTGLRFTGPTVMYGTSLKDFSVKDLYTFIGISFMKATYDAGSQKYYTDWAIALHAGAGGQFAPSTVSGVTALGLSFSTQKIGGTKLPFLVTIGVIDNLTTHQFQPGVGPGVSLLN